MRVRSNAAERITSSMATWTFIIAFLAACLLEIWWNHSELAILHHWDFDPTTIILNLILSLIAAVQGSIIMIAQKAQAERERVAKEHHDNDAWIMMDSIAADQEATQSLIEALPSIIRQTVREELEWSDHQARNARNAAVPHRKGDTPLEE